MELRQLVSFEAVARLGGFTRAAEHLHIAQPAVSAQIRQIESELGVTLLARTTRRVSLTPAGELFLMRVRRVLAELDAAKADLDELTAVLRGRVTLGATQVLGRFDLPAALTSFHSGYPGITLSLRSGLIAELLGALDAGEIDLVLGPIHSDLPSRHRGRILTEEQVVLITPPGHRLARQRRIAVTELIVEPFVCLSRSSGLRAILDAAAAAAGFEPRVQFETHSPASIRELVAAGLGVALVAASLAHAAGPSVSVHTVEPTPHHPPIGLIRHHDRRLTAAAQAFHRHLAKAAGLMG